MRGRVEYGGGDERNAVFPIKSQFLIYGADTVGVGNE